MRTRVQDDKNQVRDSLVSSTSTSSHVLIHILAAGMVLFSSLPGIASPQQVNQSSSPLIKAQSALDANQPQAAIQILSGYLRDHPADESAHLLMAEAYAMEGRPDAAAEQYQLILKSSPANYIALAGLAELYAGTGRIEQAEPLLARAVKNSQHEPQLRIEWAQVLTRLHRFKEASSALIEVAPPTSADQRIAFFRLKAAIASGLGNSLAAASHMESALAVHPENADLQLATAAAQLQAGKPERAAKLVEPVFSRTHDPDSGLILLQAQLVMHADVRQTLQALRAISMPAEREIAFRQHLAEILISHNDFAQATDDLAREADLDPSNPDLRFNLALAQFKAGKNADALAAAQKCRELRDNADVESLLGDIQEALGDNLAAVRSYQAAVAFDPSNVNHQLELALEFIRHRNFEPAKLVLQQAEKLFPRSWRVQVALGMVEYFVGTKPAASEILLRAVDLAPQPDLVFRYLGDVELDESSAPDAPAVARICAYANAHPKAAREQFYCGALMLHADYASRDTSRLDEIDRRLTFAAQALPDEAAPHCELGRAYAWSEKWKPAQQESEACVRLNPNSAQAHYRLSQIYHQTGQVERMREEIKLYKEASQRLTEENEQHENALSTFLYTIQNGATGSK